MTPDQWNIRGKTCIITGGSDGIGRAAAREFARQGAVVAIVGRNLAKTQAAAEEIEAVSGGTIHYHIADLSSQAEVRRLAQALLDRYPQIQVLLNNAGAVFDRRQITVDGMERTFALNHLAYVLLTGTLLERLEASAPARIINVSSAAHGFGGLNFDNLQGEQRYNEGDAYGRSKLANVMFTYALARRLHGTNVTVNSLHPGLVRTSFASESCGLFGLFARLARPFELSAEQGAQTSIHLATAPELTNTNGAYFAKRRPVRSSQPSYDQAAQERLWELSQHMVGLPAEI